MTPRNDKLEFDTIKLPVATSTAAETWSDIENGIWVALGLDPVIPNTVCAGGRAALAGSATPNTSVAVNNPKTVATDTARVRAGIDTADKIVIEAPFSRRLSKREDRAPCATLSPIR